MNEFENNFRKGKKKAQKIFSEKNRDDDKVWYFGLGYAYAKGLIE